MTLFIFTGTNILSNNYTKMDAIEKATGELGTDQFSSYDINNLPDSIISAVGLSADDLEGENPI